MVNLAPTASLTGSVSAGPFARMHIAFLCNEYPPAAHGGIGSFTQTMARTLASRGHQITVIGFYDQSEDVREDDHGINVVRLAHTRLRGMGLIMNSRRLTRELRDIDGQLPIDIIEGPENSLALLQEFPSAVKVIRMHGGHHFFYTTLGKKPKFWRSWLEKRSFRNADQLCGVSQFVVETTRKLLDLGARPIEVLPNAVNVMQFRPRSDVPEQQGLMIFVGTLCEKKGVRQLVQAMPRIVDAVPHARLWLVGRDSIDPQSGTSFVERLRPLILPPVKHHIELRGPVEHGALPELLSRAEVLVYPSHMEAIGIALIEGLAMGKGLIIGNTGPAKEVVEHGISGLLCDPFSPASIAEAVISLLQNPQLRRQMGKCARARAVELFSLEKIAQRNETFYSRCLGRNEHE